MDSVEGYQKINNVNLIVGEKYYFFIEYNDSASKEKISKPKIGGYVGCDMYYYKFKLEDNTLDLVYKSWGNIFIKKFDEESNFCNII